MTIQEAYKSPHLRVGVRGKEGGRGRERGGLVWRAEGGPGRYRPDRLRGSEYMSEF